MNRGRTPARGTRRGAAAAGQRAPAATGESSAGPSTAPAASTAASGSTTPAIRSASTRGAAVARATRGATVGRFRPKNIRRDEAEREELARQEEQKAREREADERRARGRSRFRSKRSRGDAMGRGGFGRIISGASGPFSSGVAGGSGGGGWFGGGGGGGNFGSGGGFGRGFKSESKPGFAQADGSRFREARINADKLHVHTPEEELDSEDEAMMNVLSTRAPSVLPMGIYRKEHKEEGVVVATTAELEAAENAQNAPAAAGEEESLWVDDDAGAGEAQAADQGEEGTWTDSKPIIKKEPGDDSIDMDIKVKPAEEKTPAEETAKPKSKKATAQELEDKFADLDLALLRSELGSIEVAEGEGEDGKKVAPSNKDGRLYLFRFPPIMPPLKQVSQPKPASKVKPEPTEANVLESTPAATDANPVDLTLEDLVSSGLNNGADDPENKHGFMPSLMTQGGMIGQLKVRKSGRTTLDWGGLLLDMGSSPDPGFLTTAVIVEENDEKPRPGVVGGESFGMGKIMGRFGLAPFWDEEEDWEVSPEELKIT